MDNLNKARDTVITLTKNLDRSVIWAAILGSFLLVCIFTFLRTSGTNAANGVSSQQPSAPREHPYLIPFLGHAPLFILCQEWFFNRLRSMYPEGIFSLRLFGSIHSFIFSPSLSAKVLNKPTSVVSHTFLHPQLITNCFGMTKPDMRAFLAVADDVNAVLQSMVTESGVKCLLDETMFHLKRNIADLVTFNSSPSDQMDWEVAAGAELVQNSKGETFVEIDLMELVRNFMAKTANQGMFGTDFVENFPDAWKHLWTYDAGFVMMTFMPSWVPVPSVGLARAAGRTFRAYMHEYHEAIDKHLDGKEDPGPRWQDLENMSSVQKARVGVFRRANLSLAARAGADLGLAWAMNANTNPLTAWMLWEISRDAVLVEQIREEIAPHVQVTQPDHDFGDAVWVAPELTHIDINAVLNQCPLLNAAYIESLRLYTASWGVRRPQEDIVVGGRDKEQAFLLKQGAWLHLPQGLHQMDPAYFPDPTEFHPERHIRETRDKQGNIARTVDMGTLKPYSKCICDSTLSILVKNF